MNQSEYSKRAQSGSVLRRVVLEEAGHLMRSKAPDIADKIYSIIALDPIERPESHKGGEESDLFHVSLGRLEIEAVVQVLGDLEVASVSSEGKTTPAASHYAEMLDLWSGIIEQGRSG